MVVALVAVSALLGSQLAGSSAAVLPPATLWATLALICVFVLGAPFIQARLDCLGGQGLWWVPDAAVAGWNHGVPPDAHRGALPPPWAGPLRPNLSTPPPASLIASSLLVVLGPAELAHPIRDPGEEVLLTAFAGT